MDEPDYLDKIYDLVLKCYQSDEYASYMVFLMLLDNYIAALENNYSNQELKKIYKDCLCKDMRRCKYAGKETL